MACHVLWSVLTTCVLLHSPHTPDSSVVSTGVTSNLCVSPGQILRDVAERSDG